MDVAYCDDRAVAEHEPLHECRLRERTPELRWEVTNQATVHRWFASELGQNVAPLKSLEEGIATWPEYATCVGVALRQDGQLEVIAPYGLQDLFGLVVRHNPARADVQTYRERVIAKRFAQRWPLLTICDC